MKLKYFAAAVALVACVFSANAQQEQKLGNDIWLGINGGVLSTTTDHLNAPNLYVGIEVGKWFTPSFGARLNLAGLTQRFDNHDGVWYDQQISNWSKKQHFGELNLDAIFNISQAITKKSLALVDFYIFAGPTMNLATKCTEFTGNMTGTGIYEVRSSDKIKARFGATAGLGVGFNLSKSCNLGIEYRTAVTPSVFGDASKWRKAENTNRLSIRFAYTFGGRLGKCGFAKKHGRVETVTNTVEVPVEKIVEKEVVKEVEKVVTKNISSDVFLPNYIFFQLGKYKISDQDKVRLLMIAKTIKDGSKEAVYVISGNADKATGSQKYNMALSEKRAKAVYDYLVEQGVNPEQLRIVANGGVENMFFDQAELSRVSIVSVTE